jgi:subtilisin-like proprotein convertase family protein
MKTWILALAICTLSVVGVKAQKAWNTAAKFTGIGYIAERITQLNSQNDVLTVEFWMKPELDSSSYTIIGKGQFRIMTDNGLIRVQTNNNTKGYSNQRISKDKWTHVAVTFNKNSGNMRIYINGSLDVTLTGLTTFTATNDSLVIGQSIYITDWYKGLLNEVRIWKTERSSSQIQANMRNSIGWYSVHNYSADLLYVRTFDFDVFSPGFYMPHGGVVGQIQGEVIGNLPSSSVFHNTSMYFANNAYLEASQANDPSLSLIGPITVEAWIYPLKTDATQTILDLSGGGGGYRLVLNNTGKISWTMNHVGTSTATIQPEKWTHVAVACGEPSGTFQTCRFYINGKEDAAFNYGAISGNIGKLRIAASQASTNYFSGYLDEIRISNYTKSIQEIQRYMHSAVLYANRPDPPKTTVSYNFDGQMYSGTRTGTTMVAKNAPVFSNRSLNIMAPLLYTGFGHMATMDSFTVKNTFKRIPSSGTAGFTLDTLVVDKDLNLSGFKVFVSLNHAAPHQLEIRVFNPTGDSVTLVNQHYSTIFTQGFTTIFESDLPISVGTPEIIDISPRIGSSGSFSHMLNKPSKGQWRMKIIDYVNGSIGELNSWGILVNGSPIVSVEDAFEGNSNQLMVRLNPEQGYVIVEIPGGLYSLGNLQLFDTQGRLVRNVTVKNEPRVNLELSSEPRGVYLLRYQEVKGTVHTRKILFNP